MVRLKAHTTMLVLPNKFCFNSTMVRLKACICSVSNPHEYCKKKMKNDSFDRQPPVMQNP